LSSTDRLRPLRREEMSPEVRELLAGTAGPVEEMEGGEGESGTLNILRTIAHHPALLEPFLGFAQAIALRGVLSRRVSELLALRAAWNSRSAFEWGHHVVFARAAGLREEEIDRIATGPAHPGWTEADRLLLEAADELHAEQDLSDATWSKLREHMSAAEPVEIPFVVGQYTMLSMVANATGVPLEDGLPPLPPTPR
jgi:alkylhydroperoxidase family enzyme